MSRREENGSKAILPGDEAAGPEAANAAAERVLQLESHDEAMQLFGPGDCHLKTLRDAFSVHLTGRGCNVTLSGERGPVDDVLALLEDMISRHRSGAGIPRDYLEKAVAQYLHRRDQEGAESAPAPVSEGLDEASPLPCSGPQALTAVEKAMAHRLARSAGQAAYLEAILGNEIVFSIGPAGTGKTYLAVHMAIHFLREDRVRKIFLCRPAVEAGEKLGFLPGDFQAKINPYLRPLYDALNDLLDFDRVKRYLEREVIEILPLAYMRGRTLNNAFIILDEGQNTTVSQMKMFLTRMGMNSRIIVTGDVTQIDLPGGQPSGLVHALRIMEGISGISSIRLGKADIVRHPLVRQIVAAYETAEEGSTEGQ